MTVCVTVHVMGVCVHVCVFAFMWGGGVEAAASESFWTVQTSPVLSIPACVLPPSLLHSYTKVHRIETHAHI